LIETHVNVKLFKSGAQKQRSMQASKRGVGVVLGKDVQVGDGCAIWNYVVIGDGAKIGEGCIIGSFVDLGKGVVLGKNCNIQAHVTISNGCVLGDNVFIAPNSSLLNDKYPKSSLLNPPVIKRRRGYRRRSHNPAQRDGGRKSRSRRRKCRS